MRSTFTPFLKVLVRNKTYAAVSIIGLSVSLLFIVVLGIYSKQEFSVDNFHENKDRIYLLTGDNGDSGFANPVGPFVKERYPEIQSYCRVRNWPTVKVGRNETESISAEPLFADSSFFQMFSFPLLDGNPDNVLAHKGCVVLSKSFANTVYGDQYPVGMVLSINGEPHTVTGIMEDFPSNTQFDRQDIVVNYTSLETLFEEDLNSWYISNYSVFFLVHKGANLQSTAEDLLKEFKKNYWLYKDSFYKELRFTSLKDAYFDAQGSGGFNKKSNDRISVMIFLGIGILILLIAILNYINITLAQSGFRGKEAAIKKLFGSGRSRLILQFLGEALILSLVSIILALILVFVTEPLFNDILSTQLNVKAQFTWDVIVGIVLVLLLLTFFAGIVPALVLSSFKPDELLHRTFSRKMKTSYARLLTIFQYTICITQLICTFFIIRQFNYMTSYNLGYDTDGVYVINNTLDTFARSAGFKSKLESLPDIETVSLANGVMFGSYSNVSFEKEGQPVRFDGYSVDTNFLNVFGITYESTGIPVTNNTVLVNQEGYNVLQPDKNTFFAQLGSYHVQIAGILSDFHMHSLWRAKGPMYISFIGEEEYAPGYIIIKMRDQSDYFELADRIGTEYNAYSGGADYRAVFMEDSLQESYMEVKKTAKLIGVFAGFSIFILVMGVLAMTLYSVKQREKEIGIRKVNGATIGQILAILNKSIINNVLIAFVISCPLAYFIIDWWLQNFIYKTTIVVWIFIATGLIVAIMSTLFVTLQSWRSATKNPMTSLKAD